VGLFYARKLNTMNTRNKVQLIGTVESYPTVNRLETEILRATFQIETPSTYFNENGIKTKGVFKHFCIAYGKLAEIIDRYVSEGAEIAIEGIMVKDESTGQPHVQVNDLLLLYKKTN
jgi:single-strand DNA-binding protein